ncbi:MAG: DNA polymerase III subunit gamma/tau [Deltaproteobacteria bacterium]|nr:DNA polymerase III subunit gamma/tau [Deltaproteobacteria bacterium]
MSYLVLARTHRPATFSQVVGQEHVSKTLAGALASGRLAHAFCFTGPRGVGKTSVARILAKALNCVEGPTAEPCGKCVHCLEIEGGHSVDVQEIDAASNSRVEDVRELREVIRYHPQSARYRVTILDEVHMLSKAAFNALLKTLEEPPDHAVFILATTDVHKVPLTILSRCQRYDFRRLDPRTIAAHLETVLAAEGLRLPPESLALMAREADGSVRDALSLLDQVLASGQEELSHPEVVELLGLVDRELVRATAQAVLDGQAGQVLELVSQVYAAGGEMQAFYGALLEQFRNLAAAKAAPPGADLFGLTAQEIAELGQQAAGASAETLHEIFDQLAASEDLFRRASRPRLVMEMTLLKLTQVRPVLSLEEVIARLGDAGGESGGRDAPPAPRGPAGPAAAPPRSAPVAPPAPPAAQSAAPATPAPAASPAASPAPAAAPAPPAPEPPATPPAPPAAGAPPAAAEAAFRELSAYCGRSEPVLTGLLGRSTARQEDGVLEITLPPGPIAASYCSAAHEGRLNQMAQDLWGGRLKVRLAAGREDEGVACPVGPDPRSAERAQQLAEHPVVLMALEVFEGQVVSLNPSSED